MSDVIEFKVGGKVVYPAHGVGRIVSEECQKVGGHDLSMFVIDFPKEKMTLRVPVKRAAASGLRVLSNDNDVKKAISVLKGRAKPGRGMWSRRAKEYEDKINSGNIIFIAEVVRDLHKNVDDPDRSYSERVIYESALGRLAGEYAAVNDIETDDATENLIKILKSRKGQQAANNDTPEASEEMDEEFEAA
ncbi:MAG: CarD-like/TRCF domain protein [Rickettsiaceae bacterium]|jgi:CarD family transcriptional regulator|nr:CarD-like/TRCF domain protein [Rickettsiaceae bacterium]